MTILEITESIDSGEKTPEEKLKILRRIRGDLMEELHLEPRSLAKPRSLPNRNP